MTADCKGTRPQLGLLLTGALSDPEQEEVLVHLDGCEACGAELAELQALGEVLSEPTSNAIAFPDRSTQPTFRWKLWAGIAAAAAVLTAAMLRPIPMPRSISGDVRMGALVLRSSELAGPAPAPLGLPLTIHEATTFELEEATLASVSAGSRLTLLAPRRLQLDEGMASFHVRSDPTPFVVVTPRGNIRTLGTSFHIEVKETTMDSKMKAAAAAVVTVVVGTGAVLFSPKDGSAGIRVDAGQRIVAEATGVKGPGAEDADALALATAQEKNAELEASAQALTLAHDALKLELEAVRAELATLRAKPAEEPAVTREPSVPAKKTLSVDYGRWAELDALESANWTEMGGAIKAMLEIMPKLYETVSAGKKPSTETQIALGRENTKLVRFAIEVMGKLPTSANQTGNGAFTHPIVFANLLVEHLELVGQALTGPQRLALSRLGADYDTEWEAAQARYTEQTYTLARLLDELTLKLKFYDGTIELLDASQRALVVRPTIQHRAGLDLYSPVLMLTGVAKGKRVDSPESLRATLEKEAQRWGFSEEDLAGQSEVFETWVSALELTPIPTGDVGFCTLQEAMTGLRAQIQAMSELELRLAPKDTVRTTLRTLPSFRLPRLVNPE